MDENHLLIRELIPLYTDDVLTDKTKEIIKTHLQSCRECRTYADALKNDKLLDSHAFVTPSESDIHPINQTPIRFITRLKRLGFMIAAAIFIVIIAVMLGSWILGREAAVAEKHKQDQQLMQMDSDLIALSPPQQTILKNSGVKLDILEKRFTENEGVLTYKYSWSDPRIDYVQEDIYWPNHLIAMDLTNNEVLELIESSSSLGSKVNKVTWKFTGLPKNSKVVGIELPNFAVFIKPETFKIPLNPNRETIVNQTITVNNVHFLIRKVEFTNKRIVIHYEQLDDISKVGLYQLSFNVIDANHAQWNKEPQIDFQIGKERTASIPIYRDMAEPFQLQLEHGVLIAPGLHFKFSVE